MFSIHRRRRISPRRPMCLLIVGSDCCVMRFAYALHMRCQNLVLLSCVYIEPFELVIEIVFHYCTEHIDLPAKLLDYFLRSNKSNINQSRLPAAKLIGSNVDSGAAALSALMMLLCCSLASSSLAPRKSLFPSDDCLNCRMQSVR